MGYFLKHPIQPIPELPLTEQIPGSYLSRQTGLLGAGYILMTDTLTFNKLYKMIYEYHTVLIFFGKFS
jgi:hypothetical protein